MLIRGTPHSPPGCEIMGYVPRDDHRCIDIVSSNRCPLSVAGRCSVRGTRIRLPQHAGHSGKINSDWVASCDQDKPAASFLGLPREIRDAIYAIALPTNETFYLGHLVLDFDQKLSHVHQIHPARAPASWLSLFTSSKQLHSEAAAHLFTTNTFSMCFHPDGRHLGASILDTFQFRDLVPLHPMYARFVREVELEHPPQRNRSDPMSIKRPEGLHLSSRPASSDDQIRRFVDTMQAGLDAAIPCKCLKLIPLGSGTYTLRRPPGRAREKCRRATLRRIEPWIRPEVERMRRGEFEDTLDRCKRVHVDGFAAWQCLLLGCVACIVGVATCCLCCGRWDRVSESERWKQEIEEAARRERRARAG